MANSDKYQDDVPDNNQNGEKRPQSDLFESATTSPKPVAPASSGPIRIAERARLSLKGARAVAGKTIQRWTSNIAGAASGPFLPQIPIQNLTFSASPSTVPPTNVPRVSSTLDLTDTSLLRLAARPPGCLFDDKFLTRFERESRADTSEKRYRVVEVQFRDRAGLTLDVSRAYEERIYVDGFSSDESPALLSNAVSVGDTLLSAAGGDRWLRSTGNLDAISQFIRDCARPVTIRFLRDLFPPVTLSQVHEDPSKAAFWLEFLAESSVAVNTSGGGNAGEAEQIYTVDPTTSQLRSIWEGKSLAHFALDARFSVKTEQAVEAIVERHLPFARTPAEQSLIDWYHARKSLQRKLQANESDAGVSNAEGLAVSSSESSSPRNQERSQSTEHRMYSPPASPPASSTADAINIPVFDVLELAANQIEDALAQAYFKRFLHSSQALALYKEFKLPYERPSVRACATEVSLEAVLSRRPLANLFLAHCLPRYQGVHPKLLLWMEVEYALRPAIDIAEEAFDLTADYSNNDLENRTRVKLDAIRGVWQAASRIYERYLSPKGACYCGELSNNANATVWAAYSAFSRETWGETGFCTTCGRESRQLIHDIEDRVEAMERDRMDVGFISLESLRTLSFAIQSETLEFLRKHFNHFCQDPNSWFPVVVEGFNAEVASTGSDAQTVVPRFSTVLQHGVPLPRGIETHRAPTDYYRLPPPPPPPPPQATSATGTHPILATSPSTTSSGQRIVKCMARFRLDEENNAQLIESFGDFVPDGIGKFAFPWAVPQLVKVVAGINSNGGDLMDMLDGVGQSSTHDESRTEHDSADEDDLMENSLLEDGKLCFNFVTGSEKLHGVSLVSGRESLVAITDKPLFNRLKEILVEYSQNPHDYFVIVAEQQQQQQSTANVRQEDVVVESSSIKSMVETPYGTGEIVSNDNREDEDKEVINVKIGGEGMILPFRKSELGGAAASRPLSSSTIIDSSKITPKQSSLHPNPTIVCGGCGINMPCWGRSRPNFWFPSPIRNDFSFDLLLESLSPRNIVALFSAMLLERKILLVSSKYTVLTAVGESMCSLLHPLRWSHVYAPLLPRKMLDLIMCPTPFLLGIHSSYAFKSDFPFATDVIVVNLDMDDLTAPSPLVRLPHPIEHKLLRRIKRVTCPLTIRADDSETRTLDLDASRRMQQRSRDELIRDAFRQAVLELTNNVQLACFSVEHRGEVITFIDENFWLNSKRPDELEFLNALLRTQGFSSFLGGMRA